MEGGVVRKKTGERREEITKVKRERREKRGKIGKE